MALQIATARPATLRELQRAQNEAVAAVGSPAPEDEGLALAEFRRLQEKTLECLADEFDREFQALD